MKEREKYFRKLGYKFYISSDYGYYISYKGNRVISNIEYGKFIEECEKHLAVIRLEKLRKVKI